MTDKLHIMWGSSGYSTVGDWSNSFPYLPLSQAQIKVGCLSQAPNWNCSRVPALPVSRGLSSLMCSASLGTRAYHFYAGARSMNCMATRTKLQLSSPNKECKAIKNNEPSCLNTIEYVSFKFAVLAVYSWPSQLCCMFCTVLQNWTLFKVKQTRQQCVIGVVSSTYHSNSCLSVEFWLAERRLCRFPSHWHMLALHLLHCFGNESFPRPELCTDSTGFQETTRSYPKRTWLELLISPSQAHPFKAWTASNGNSAPLDLGATCATVLFVHCKVQVRKEERAPPDWLSPRLTRNSGERTAFWKHLLHLTRTSNVQSCPICESSKVIRNSNATVFPPCLIWVARSRHEAEECWRWPENSET